MVEVRAREDREKAERDARVELQRKVQRAWARWMRWRLRSPDLADAYRRAHQDSDGGDLGWLPEFASFRIPRAPSGSGIPKPKRVRRAS
jgi:hypothetical protein